MILPLAFTGSAIDRDDHTRADPERIAQARAHADARVLALEGLIPALDQDDRLTYLPVTSGEELAYLGRLEGAPLFVAMIRQGDTRPGYQQAEVRAILPRLRPEDLALYGQARALVDWHARNRFCSNCGGTTALAKGGWQRDCAACGTSHFPRTDPVAIMLVEHDGELLLGRGLGWPEGQYSALAGFIEPGESVEEGVAREVLEEAGVTVTNVTYVASQPWPFPSQLMIGCYGFAAARDLTVDHTELADVRWFTRDEVFAAMQEGGDAPFRAPPPFAIASNLLRWWLDMSN